MFLIKRMLIASVAFMLLSTNIFSPEIFLRNTRGKETTADNTVKPIEVLSDVGQNLTVSTNSSAQLSKQKILIKLSIE